jgi:hypothetical protein
MPGNGAAESPAVEVILCVKVPHISPPCAPAHADLSRDIAVARQPAGKATVARAEA